jgi:hypothetical protein
VLSLDIRMSVTFTQIRQLMAAGFLPAEPEGPGDLRDALNRVLATLPMPRSATPACELRAAQGLPRAAWKIPGVRQNGRAQKAEAPAPRERCRGRSWW